MRWILLFICVPMLLLDTAGAKEFIPRLGLSAEKHTNILKTRDNEVGDTILTPYFGFLFAEQAPNVAASIDLEVRSERYADDTYDSQNLYSINSFVDWVILPNRFVWAVEDLAYSQRINVFDPSTPDNLQNFNVFTTGPDFVFSSGIYEGLVKLRLGDVYYSDSGADNQRIIGSASIKRFLTDYSLFGFNGAVSVVDFEEDFRVNYDVGFLAAKYERELPYGTFELSAGVNWANHDDGVEENAPMAQLNFQYDGDGGVDVFKLAISTKYSDSALDAYDPLYSRLYDVGVNKLANVNETTGVGAFDSDRGEVGYTYNGQLIKLSLLAFFSKRDFFSGASEANVEQVGYGTGLSYQARENLSLWASYYLTDSDYPTTDSYVKGTTPSFGINYTVSDTVSLTMGISFAEEKSSVPGRGYDNDVTFLRIDYRGVPKDRK